LFAFLFLSLGDFAHALCPISEKRCSDILNDRFGLSVQQFHDAPELKQLILQDTLHCIEQDLCPLELDIISGEEQLCTNGLATDLEYPCSNVDLMSFLPLPDLGSHANASGNDIWGWTRFDDATGDATGYYALTGQSDGSSIVDITDPINPNVLAFVPTSVDPMRFCIWRDIKTYGDYAFVVADDLPQSTHGMQILNLPAIIAKAEDYQSESDGGIYNVALDDTDCVTMYEGFGSSHNVFVNEDTGYLYSVGVYGLGDEDTVYGQWNGTDDTNMGIHVVDISDPTNPTLAGIFSDVNYTHDIQCVVYDGPDTDFVGHEICFAFTPAVRAVTIIDVTDKDNMTEISRTEQMNSTRYVHQGWLTTNHEFLLMDDELDEVYGSVQTQTTFIYDVRNLSNPVLVDFYDSNLTVIDHNQYIIDNGLSSEDAGYKGFSFQSNYEAGLRILSLDDVANGSLSEIAFFDSYIWEEYWENVTTNETDYDLIEGERHDTVSFRGSWSVFPFFKPHRDEDGYSDIVVLHNINTGLFVLRHNIGMGDLFGSAASEVDSEVVYVGIAVASAFFAALLVLLVFLCCRKKNNQQTENKAASPHHVQETSPISVDAQNGRADGHVDYDTQL